MASDDTAWLAAGNCRDLPANFFFPSDGRGVLRARRICEDCPVRETCLEYALANHIERGVWGTSERERRRLARSRRKLQQASA